MKWFDDIKKYYLYRALTKRFALPVIVLFMLQSGLSVQEIAFIAGASAIISFALEVPSGSISDTIGHKRALVLAAIGQGTSMLLYLGGRFEWILAGSLLYFASGTLMTGTHDALIFERLAELKKTSIYRKLLGNSRAISDAWSMATIAFAGILFALNQAIPFVIGASLLYLSAVIIATFKAANKISVEKLEGYKQLFSHFSKATNTLQKNKRLLFLALTNSIIFGSVVAATEFHQVILSNIGLAASFFGIIYALKRLSSVVLAPQLHRLTKRMNATMVLSYMGLSGVVFFLLTGVVTNHVLMAIVVLLPTINFTIMSVVIKDVMNQLIPTGSRATTISFTNLIDNAIKLITIAVIGAIAAVVTIELAHIWIAVGLGVILLILLPLTHRAFARGE